MTSKFIMFIRGGTMYELSIGRLFFQWCFLPPYTRGVRNNLPAWWSPRRFNIGWSA